MMFQVIFQKQSKRCKSAGNFWPILLLVTVVLVVGVYVFTDGRYIAVGPSPLLIFLIWYFTKNKMEEVTLFLQKDNKGEFEFGYKDASNITSQIIPVEEYTYWYVEGSSSANGWNYELYFQINSKGQQYYFKEKMTGRTPPKGWPASKQKIKEAVGVFHVPQLVELAKLIDNSGSVVPIQGTSEVINSDEIGG